MQCKQLNRLVKEWHSHVCRDTMAPARMMQFVDNHVKQCDICRKDNSLFQKLVLLRERVMPKEDIVSISSAEHDLFTPDIFEERDRPTEDIA